MASGVAKRKRFPIEPRSELGLRLLQSCAAILAINWVCQGMRGMERKELSFRLGMETVLIALIGLPLAALGVTPPATLAAALLLAHTTMFLANGQLWVCVRYCPSWRGSAARLGIFLDHATTDLRACAWLDEAVCIGSTTTAAGSWGNRSDLDLRLIFPPGVEGWLRTNLLLLELRLRALLALVPLDLYAYDGPEGLSRFDQREPLGIILDRRGRLARRFVGRHQVGIE